MTWVIDHVVIHADYKKNKVTYKGKVAILAVGANMRLLTKLGILKEKPKLIMAVRGYYEGVEGLTDNIHNSGLNLLRSRNAA